MRAGARGLEGALAEHRAAVEDFVAAAMAIAPADWQRPVAEKKWSPGQITEHLCLALEKVRQELEHGAHMKFALPAWRRLLLRRLLLPRLLRTGRFPRGVRAPREIRPSPSAASLEDSLRRLQKAAAEVEAACARDSRAASRRLGHPYFGALPLPKFFRLLAQHTLHHRGQLPHGS